MIPRWPQDDWSEKKTNIRQVSNSKQASKQASTATPTSTNARASGSQFTNMHRTCKCTMASWDLIIPAAHANRTSPQLSGREPRCTRRPAGRPKALQRKKTAHRRYSGRVGRGVYTRATATSQPDTARSNQAGNSSSNNNSNNNNTNNNRQQQASRNTQNMFNQYKPSWSISGQLRPPELLVKHSCRMLGPRGVCAGGRGGAALASLCVYTVLAS